MPSEAFDSLLGQVNRGEFLPPEEPIAEVDNPAAQVDNQPEEESFFDDLSDAALAIPRGIIGAGKSFYNLADVVAFDSLPDWERNPLGSSRTVVGGLIEGVSEFAAGFAALGPVVGAIGKGVKGAQFLLNAEKTGLSMWGRVAQGAATDFAAFDAQSGRLADLVAKIPGLEGPMHEYLNFALTDPEDGEILGRIKNTLEGAGVGAAFDVLIKGLKYMRRFNQETAAGKTADEAHRAADKDVPQVDLERASRRLDDLRLAEESPLQGPAFESAFARSAEAPVRINADGTEAPAGANLLALAESKFSTKEGLTNWANQHGSLLDNPLVAIELHNGKATIGLNLRPEHMENPKIKKMLDSLEEAC